MEEISIKREYLKGTLILVAIVLLGLFLNSTIGLFGFVKMLWPQNLIVISIALVLGLCIGFIANSQRLWFFKSVAFILPTLMFLMVIGAWLMLHPDAVGKEWLSPLLQVPAFLAAVYVFLSSGIYVALNVSSFKNRWSSIVLSLVSLVFIFGTVVGKNDYYQLAMRIGSERAIFEANEVDGDEYYQLPFAVKLITSIVDESIESQISKASVRVFNTVEDFEDVELSLDNNFKIKGWVIALSQTQYYGSVADDLVDIDLVFDRWIELKYFSLGFLLIGLILRRRSIKVE
ncbi:hypothetical protein [Carboxylicivirga sp. M1479]|uniref:hypothetical protein n=1 Tax=Carboxylicivirga sp. M1479 TaxID=2594476 RepID=UPI00117814E1|nr:hypothetical protein [Carboxylicivirga sp. M1479]TRX71915.1 hypothetical protein FNN09_04650 [Carboxylicivirga sp. M1479]